MANILDAKKQSFFPEDNIMIDTNVWIYMEGPEAAAHDRGYSDIYYQMLESGAKLYVNFSIISEFINHSIYLSYDSFRIKRGFTRKEFPFKNCYKKEQDFKEHYAICLGTVEEDILSKATLITTYSDSGKKAFEDSKKLGNILDFNDFIIIEDSLRNNCKVLTADGDYAKYPGTSLKVITNES